MPTDDQFLDRFLSRLRLGEIAKERSAAEMCERSPDVGLKQHDNREDHVRREVSNQPVDRFELQPARQEEQPDQEPAAERHLHGPRPSNEEQQLVDQNRYDRDVDHVVPRNGRALKQLVEKIHQGHRTASKTPERGSSDPRGTRG